MRRFATEVFQTFQSPCKSKTENWPRQIFSAIQPTGDVHLGNYLGAIKNWVYLQDTESNRVIYSIADLHSITLPKEPQELNNNIFKMAATLLACGIDTKKSLLFQQSMVPQHSELSWILGTLTTMPTLKRLPQFQEKSKLVKDVLAGIFLYPVLQSADIMLYKTTHVPVGEDQIQQIELTMHLIKVFNNKFGETFPMCDVLINSCGSRVKSLTNPAKKMSKSDLSEKSVISLIDDDDMIVYKCQKAVSDGIAKVSYDPTNRPGVSNMINIHSGLTGKSVNEIAEEYQTLTIGEYKSRLSSTIIECLKPIRRKIFDYLENKDYLVKELEKGAEEAQEIASHTLKEVKEKMGFDLYNVRLKLNENESPSQEKSSALG